MNTLEINGNLNVAKGAAIKNWATLTQDDLRYVKGEHNEWFARIEKRIGQNREQIESAIQDFFSSHS